MTLKPRDKKLLMIIVPIALLAAYWLLLLSPKREEAAAAGQELVAQQGRRDDALAKLSQAESAQTRFASDYASVVRLGKAVPDNVDMPSMLVQLDRASRGTDINFDTVKVSDGDAAGGSGSSSSSSSSGASAAPSSGSASSGSSSGASAAQSSGSSASSKPGAAPAGGAASSTGAPQAPGLTTVPLEFKFVGDYFDLASFFHRMKRFVYVANNSIQIHGRLMTIDSMTIKQEPEEPGLTAEMKATVYLTPPKEGATGGATPGGPGASKPAGASSSSTAQSSAPPTAAVTR